MNQVLWGWLKSNSRSPEWEKVVAFAFQRLVVGWNNPLDGHFPENGVTPDLQNLSKIPFRNS